MSHSFIKHILLTTGAIAVLLALIAAPAAAQIVIKSEDATFKFGFQGQLWADWTQDSTAANQGYQQNLYLRRARLLLSGDIGHDISFFVETDSPNLGKTPKAPSSGFMLQDAFLEWKPTKVLQIDGGLFLVPLSRNALQSTLSYYTIDISPLTTVNNSATQSAGLRDLGFQARGFFLRDRLQYRLGAFQGERDSNARNSLRTAAYLQYDFFDTETGYVFAGTALGKKKILAIDAGGDKQGGYRGLSANAALDLPVNGGDEIGGQFQFFHYDGRRKFISIADQNDWFVETAYYIHRARLQPFAKFESQNFLESANASNDIHRVGAGVNLYVRGQNLKWTFQYNRLLPRNGSPLKASNEVTMQLQLFYF
jgi:Phosphate-selective porin O and P